MQGSALRWLVGTLLAIPTAIAANAPTTATAPTTLQRSKWNGFDRLDFTLAGCPCILVPPASAAPGRPWIWRTEFFDHEPQADVALLGRGWHVAYMDAHDLYGAPKAIALFNQFYAHLVIQASLSKRVVLEGFSRGGLYAINFAIAHPTSVAALYLDAPVLDIRSWPGKNRQSKEWKDCLEAYNLTDESLEKFKPPLDRLQMIIGAKIPILVVAGDADQTVPFAENGGLLEKRYRELGGNIKVILKPGGDHHPHSLKDPAPIVDFLIENAKF